MSLLIFYNDGVYFFAQRITVLKERVLDTMQGQTMCNGILHP